MSSLMRISGIATGLDTASIIDSLVQIEQQPEVMLKRQQQILNWKKDYWGEINTKLLAAKTAVASLLDRGKILAWKATSSDDKVLTATASGTAAAGAYTITITSLASETTLRGGPGALNLGLGGKVVVNQAVNSDASKLGVKINAGTFTINGVQFTINSGDYLGTGNTADPLDILGKINAATGTTGVTATYDAGTDKLVLTTTGSLNLGSGADTSNFLSATGLLAAPLEGGTTKRSMVHLGRINPDQTLALANFATAMTDDGTGHGAFKINGVEIAYNATTDTLNTVINRINGSTANVTAAYDATTDRLVLRSKTTGSVGITVEEVTGKGNFLTATALTAAAGGTQTLGNNAVFTVSGFNNDQPITRTSNSVSDVISGVTLNLKSPTSGTPVTLTVAQDVEAAKTAIKDFVGKFNEAISLINLRLSEKKVTGKDWDKMTDAERKMGIMRGESSLVDLRFRLTSLATGPVPGLSALTDALSDIGIKTGVTTSSASSTTGENGTLVIDDAKLTAALTNSPEMVADLFFLDLDGDGKVTKDANGVPTDRGVAVQLDWYLDQLTDSDTVIRGSVSVKAGIVPRQQDVLTSRADDLQGQIDAYDRRIELYQANLIRQFTLMEQVVGQFQATSSWLTSQTAKL